MMSHSPHDVGAHLVIVEGEVPERVGYRRPVFYRWCEADPSALSEG